VLDHLSGPSIGLQTLLFSAKLNVYLGDDRLVSVEEIKGRGKKQSRGKPIARLIRTDDSYRLEAGENFPIWINGRQTDSAELHDDDVIEFGEKGPLSRFRLIDGSKHRRRYFAEICDDCWDYIRASRKPVPRRLANAVGDGMRRIAGGTTLLFRATVVVFMVLMGFVIYQQYNINKLQQMEITAGLGRLENFANTLARAREEALTPRDLIELKSTLTRDLSMSSDRLEALEKRSSATEAAIKASSSSAVRPF